MKLREICYDIYSGFVSNYYSIDRGCATDLENKIIVNFLIQVHKKIGLPHIGRNFIKQYLIYQFDYWIDKDVKFSDKFSVSKIFALKSFSRYINGRDSLNWYMASKNVEKYFADDQKSVIDYTSLDEHEESLKKMFLNKSCGMGYCLENTTLFNHKSSNCMFCKRNRDCKKILKKLYPVFYKERGYEV